MSMSTFMRRLPHFPFFSLRLSLHGSAILSGHDTEVRNLIPQSAYRHRLFFRAQHTQDTRRLAVPIEDDLHTAEIRSATGALRTSYASAFLPIMLLGGFRLDFHFRAFSTNLFLFLFIQKRFLSLVIPLQRASRSSSFSPSVGDQHADSGRREKSLLVVASRWRLRGMTLF